MKHIVGVADMRISKDPEDILVTHALGSCLGIVVYDPVACVGGMLHVMLPQSSIDSVKAENQPLMFVDTGVPKLFRESYGMGAVKQRMVVKVAGGACVNRDEDKDYFQIGKRNFISLRNLLWKNGVLLSSYDVGGSDSRGLSLEMGSGEVIVKTQGQNKPL